MVKIVVRVRIPHFTDAGPRARPVSGYVIRATHGFCLSFSDSRNTILDPHYTFTFAVEPWLRSPESFKGRLDRHLADRLPHLQASITKMHGDDIGITLLCVEPVIVNPEDSRLLTHPTPQPIALRSYPGSVSLDGGPSQFLQLLQ